MRFSGLWWTLGVLWLAWVSYASLMPAPPGAGLLPDKLQHILVYASLGFWFGCLVRPNRHWHLVAVLALWGGALEVLQGMGGMRHAEGLDALGNGCGALLGVAVTRTPCGQLLYRMEQGLQWLL